MTGKATVRIGDAIDCGGVANTASADFLLDNETPQ